MKTCALIVGLYVAMRCACWAAETGAWHVQVVVRMISVPTGSALGLAQELRRPQTYAVGEQRIEQMVTRGEAKLAGWLVARGQNGRGFASESTTEVRSETEPPYPDLVLGGSWRPVRNLRDAFPPNLPAP